MLFFIVCFYIILIYGVFLLMILIFFSELKHKEFWETDAYFDIDPFILNSGRSDHRKGQKVPIL